jgi:acetoacetate decarboxylase
LCPRKQEKSAPPGGQQIKNGHGAQPTHAKNNNMKNKMANGDVMLALIEQMGGAAMVASFNKEMLPLFGGTEKWNEPLTDEQHQHALTQIERELPALHHWLATTDLDATINPQT